MINKKAYGRKTTICPICGKVMELDDIDYNFKGNQDEVYCCYDCNTTAYVKVRYSKVTKTEYVDEDGKTL